MTWDELKFWDSGEWQVIQEKLDALDLEGRVYNPRRENLFASLDAIPFDHVKVAWLGQDPYPDPSCATGLAFSIPCGQKKFPPTLANIFKEYVEDLHLPFPTDGSLLPWANQGVILWNSTPTCYAFEPASHRDWTEWTYLTKEIVEKLSEKGIIFVLLGGHARDYLKYINPDNNVILSYSHPSPLGATKSRSPFLGSRIFSTINDHLCKLNRKPVDWSL